MDSGAVRAAKMEDRCLENKEVRKEENFKICTDTLPKSLVDSCMVEASSSSAKSNSWIAERNDQKFQVEFDSSQVNYLLEQINIRERTITEFRSSIIHYPQYSVYNKKLTDM